MGCRFLRVLLWAAFCLSLVLVPRSLSAQTTGRLNGSVTDPSGAVVPAAKITIVNEATGVSRVTQADKDGAYSIPEVPVGSYRIEAEQTGFKKIVRHGIPVLLNQVATVNLKLELGATEETVEVSTEAPLVDTNSTQIGATVDERSVAELPLNARDTYQFLQLQPGVQSQLGGNGDLFYGSDRAGAVSVNGGRGRSNNFNVNGGDANDQFANLPTVQPSPDSIEEFRVLTNTFDAEYGRNSGAVVNVVTKSGTNQFHGNFYEFFRNKALNAKGYFDTEKPAFEQNQYGATFGGPIKKDHTFFFASYEGRRITQGKSSDVVNVLTPGQLAGNFGTDLSAFEGSIQDNFVAQVLNSRAGGACASAIQAQGGTLPAVGVNWSSIFPNNQIPTACMDPVALNLAQRFIPSSASGLYQGVPKGTDHQEQGTIRLDHRLTDKQQLSFYYYVTDDLNFAPFSFFQASGANVPGFGSSVGQRFQQYNLSHTWTLTTSVVNEARFSYNREAQRTFQAPQLTGAVTSFCTGSASAYCFTGTSDSSAIQTQLGTSPSLGITTGLPSQYTGLPFINISGGAVIGNNYQGQLPQVGNSFQWSDNLSWVKGSHTMKFGADVRRQRFDQTLFFNVNGYYTFLGQGANSISSNPYADFLLGLADSYSQGSAQAENVRSTGVYLFAQDSWKASKSLTVNYGLRWELNTPMTDILHHVQTFRPGQNSTVYPCQLSPASQASLGASDCLSAGVQPTGLVVPGDKGVPGGLTQTNYHDFAPRIGIAYSPRTDKGWLSKLTGGPDNFTIHAGFGLFYNPIEQLVLEQFGAEPPFGGSSALSNIWFNTPFVGQNSTVSPNPFTGILDPKRGTPVDWSTFRPILLYGEFQPHMHTQYSEQYNLMLQRQLGKDIVVQVGYVGSQGHHLLATHDVNAGNPQTCLDISAVLGDGTCGPYGADSAYFIPGGTVLPVDFHLPYGPNGPTVLPKGTTVGANGITLVGTRPYSSPNCNPLTGAGCPTDGVPVFSNIFAEDTIANSNYNSLQLMVEKRFSHGVQLQGSYTWSKSIDQASSFEELLNPFNPRATRALSLFDARNRFVLSYYWDIPTRAKGGWKHLVNNWAISGISSFQSGFPIRLQTMNDNELVQSVDFTGTGTPVLTGPVHFVNPKKSGGYWFDPNSFSDPNLGTYSTTTRSLCCGPGTNNTDLALHKKLMISENHYFQLRAEFFNVFNHTQFFNPDGNYSNIGVTTSTTVPFQQYSGTFGQIRRAREPRQMQLAIKFYY
jgi:hypothetical protein